MKALFAAALLGAVNADLSHDDHHLNSHYDNSDPSHYYYGSDSASSPAYPTVPEYSVAVDHFDDHGTLFGEHRYQLQVGKTANMLIAVDALRQSIYDLAHRIGVANHLVHQNSDDITLHDQQIDHNSGQIHANSLRLSQLDE